MFFCFNSSQGKLGIYHIFGHVCLRYLELVLDLRAVSSSSGYILQLHIREYILLFFFNLNLVNNI